MAKDPFRPLDEEARALVRELIDTATYAALAVQGPSVTRIALATDGDGVPISLISTLSTHTQALEQDPTCALLIGEPDDKGDPLTYPRLTLHATAQIIPRDHADHGTIRTRYLKLRPKAKLYADFRDFRFVRFHPTDALLNAGFGRAFKLAKSDFT